MKKKTYNKDEEILDEEILDEEILDEEILDEEILDEEILDIDESELEAFNELDKPNKKEKIKKEKFYVEPKKFDEEICAYYDNGILTDELADMLSKIAHKLSYAKNFINYTYREDMVGDALIRMFKALMSKKYDREKGTNPFSYFTRIAFNAFRNRIKKEKHISETHFKYQEELLMMSENQNIFKNKKGLFASNEN